MSATILISERSCVERIRSEGGLRASFCRVFRGSLIDTADATTRGDGQGFDDLLRDYSLVCLDAALLKPIESSATNRVERERYRNNLLHKVAARQHVWVEVISGGEREQEEQLAELEARIGESRKAFGEHAHQAIVIFVFAQSLSTGARSTVERFGAGQVSGVAKVYVMFDRLQLSGRRTTAIAALHVWPVCVARLLAALALAPLENARKFQGMFVWRTIVWGSVTVSEWSANYRSMIRGRLLPSKDAEGASDALSRKLERASADGFREIGNPFDGQASPNVVWGDDAEELRERAFSYVAESVFVKKLESAGSHVKQKRALKTNIDDAAAVLALSKTEWESVAADDGLVKLRRMKEGRNWTINSLLPLHEVQRNLWGAILEGRRRLNIAREHHRDAAEEISIARRRHLSLLWRLIIAFAVILFIGQFLFSALTPLRPPADQAKGWAELFEELKGTDFWGLKVDKGQTVYVVDCSGSMAGARFEKTKEKLKESILELPPESKYCVVFFNHDQVVLASSRELANAIESTDTPRLQAIEKIEAGGGTDPTTALAFAFGLLELPPPPPPPPAPIVPAGAVDPNAPPPPRVVPPVVANPPSLIVLMTDGMFANNEQVFATIERFNSVRGAKDKVKVNTVAIDYKGAEDTLKKIAADTGGDYKLVQFDVFDLFAPLGFHLVLAIILGASAIGVTIGALVPWLLEVWRGRRGCRSMESSLMGLRREFGHLAADTQDLLKGATVVKLESAYNAAATAQRALAARAYSVVDGVLLQTGVQDSSAQPARYRSGGPLAAEDQNDLRELLDIPCVASSDARDEFDQRLKEIADEDANSIRVKWKQLCEAQDLYSHGHLPSSAIEEALGTALEMNIDKVSVEFMWKALEDAKAGGDEEIARLVTQSLTCESMRPCISGRIANPRSGKWPPALVKVFHAVPVNQSRKGSDRSKAIVAGIKDSRPQGVTIDALAAPVTNLGLVALGFAHEELRVMFAGAATNDPHHDVAVAEVGAA